MNTVIKTSAAKRRDAQRTMALRHITPVIETTREAHAAAVTIAKRKPRDTAAWQKVAVLNRRVVVLSTAQELIAADNSNPAEILAQVTDVDCKDFAQSLLEMIKGL